MLIERDARTANILASLGCPPDLLRTTVLEERRTPVDVEDDGDALLALAQGSGVAWALADLGVTDEALAAAIERARGDS